MRVFVLGGTGVIGSAAMGELIARGHEVFALARPHQSSANLGKCGATPIAGDIASPEPWTSSLPQIDAVTCGLRFQQRHGGD